VIFGVADTEYEKISSAGWEFTQGPESVFVMNRDSMLRAHLDTPFCINIVLSALTSLLLYVAFLSTG
jgi:hypothetical protein